VTNEYPTEDQPGAAPCIRDQLSALQAQGVQVDLLYIQAGDRLSYGRAAWRLFLSTFRHSHYDLVHAYYGHCGLLARLQVRHPIVVTFRGSDLLSFRDGIIGKTAAQLADAVIVMSQEMKQASRRRDAHIIPFGVNADIFRPASRERARRQLGLPLDAELVLFPWNPARPVKRADLAEGAIERLKDKHGAVRLITLFGQPHTTVAQFMNACDAMVLTSDYEGAPMAVREAMACNLPIVSVDAGDVSQIIGGTESCYLCERTVQDVAAKLDRVLKRGERTNGVQKVGTLDAEWAAKQVIAIYRRVLAGRR
jgi:glycosyltransferase involved in cell wall biosynthesis